MGFRVVNKSYFIFETDLGPSTRNIHPSGVLHAFRSTPAPASGLLAREEQTFAWINNSLHIELAIQHLEKSGFDRVHGIVFIPYSTKRNWLDRYPHAEPALETTMGGEVVVHLEWRPYPNGMTEVGDQHPTTITDGGSGSVEKAIGVPANAGEMAIKLSAECSHRRRKMLKYKTAPPNIVKDNSLLPNVERDELHIEIYNYLSWLHEKLAAIERENEEAEAAVKVKAGIPEEDESGNENVRKSSYVKRKKTSIPGVDVSKLKSVVDTYEITFAVILNAEKEKEMEQQGESQVQSGSKGATFLEEALSDALEQVVDAREMAGKPKRSRTWQRKSMFPGAEKKTIIKEVTEATSHFAGHETQTSTYIMANSKFKHGLGSIGGISIGMWREYRGFAVPPDFLWPTCNLRHAWDAWLFGMPNHRSIRGTGEDKVEIQTPVRPLRLIVNLRMLPRENRVRTTFCDSWKPVLKLMDDGTKSLTHGVNVRHMDAAFMDRTFEAGRRFLEGKYPSLFKKEQNRQWAVSTWSKLIRKSNRVEKKRKRQLLSNE